MKNKDYYKLTVDDIINDLYMKKKYSAESKEIIVSTLKKKYLFEDLFKIDSNIKTRQNNKSDNLNLIDGIMKENKKLRQIMREIISNNLFTNLKVLGKYKLPEVDKELLDTKYLKSDKEFFPYFQHFLLENNFIKEDSILKNIPYSILKNSNILLNNLNKESYYPEENVSKIIIKKIEDEIKNILNINIKDYSIKEKNNDLIKTLSEKEISEKEIQKLLLQFKKPTILEFTRTQTNIIDKDKGLIQIQKKNLNNEELTKINKINKLMQEININTIEYDKETKLDLLETQLELLKNLDINFLEPITLKLRKIGNYKSNGFYVPNINILVIGSETNASAFLHEVTHAIDFQKKNIRENEKVKIMIDYFKNKMNLNQINEKQLNYFLSDVEVLARLGELYFFFNKSDKVSKQLENQKSISLIKTEDVYTKHKNIYFHFNEWNKDEKELLKNTFEKIIFNPDYDINTKNIINYEKLKTKNKILVYKNYNKKEIKTARELLVFYLSNNKINVNNLDYKVIKFISVNDVVNLIYNLYIDRVIKKNEKAYKFFNNIMKQIIPNKEIEINREKDSILRKFTEKTYLNYLKQSSSYLTTNDTKIYNTNKINFVINNKEKLKYINNKDETKYILINKNKLINIIYEQLLIANKGEENTNIIYNFVINLFKNKQILNEKEFKEIIDSFIDVRNLIYNNSRYLIKFLEKILINYTIKYDESLDLDVVDNELLELSHQKNINNITKHLFQMNNNIKLHYF